MINSQPSKEALENLIKDMAGTFGLTETIDDLFYYGVFCKPQNYANYNYDIEFSNKLDVPEFLADCDENQEKKISYVNSIIGKVMRKEIAKPEWMKQVELSADCNEYGQPPSTFLYIEPKETYYEAFAERLIEFLYSPNLNITMVEA